MFLQFCSQLESHPIVFCPWLRKLEEVLDSQLITGLQDVARMLQTAKLFKGHSGELMRKGGTQRCPAEWTNQLLYLVALESCSVVYIFTDLSLSGPFQRCHSPIACLAC